jgi:hypothetical protein
MYQIEACKIFDFAASNSLNLKDLNSSFCGPKTRKFFGGLARKTVKIEASKTLFLYASFVRCGSKKF